MKYLSDIQIDDEVISIIYGDGIITNVLDKQRRADGFFMCTASYLDDNGGEFFIHYTEDGIASWCNKDIALCGKTIYIKADLDIKIYDYSANTKPLSMKKIKKLYDSEELEIRTPAGFWLDIDKVPESLINKYIKKGFEYMFRESL